LSEISPSKQRRINFKTSSPRTHGNVIEVDMIMDKFSGLPRGFAFVTMETKEAADAALQALDGKNEHRRPGHDRQRRASPRRTPSAFRR